jgi:hypothetical protein
LVRFVETAGDNKIPRIQALQTGSRYPVPGGWFFASSPRETQIGPLRGSPLGWLQSSARAAPPHPGRLTRPRNVYELVGNNGLRVAYDVTAVSPLLGPILAPIALTTSHAVIAEPSSAKLPSTSAFTLRTFALFRWLRRHLEGGLAGDPQDSPHSEPPDGPRC